MINFLIGIGVGLLIAVIIAGIWLIKCFKNFKHF